MATRHRLDLLKRNTTLAVIDSKADRKGLSREEYTRDVIHRWAHRIADQAEGKRYKYRLSGRSLIRL